MKSVKGPAEKTFFGHPRALGALFYIELFERFAYIGIQSIILIYMYYEANKGGLGIDVAVAGGFLGLYGGTINFCTLVAAWLADRILGPEKLLFYSSIILTCGTAVLTLVPGISGLALAVLLLGIGSCGIRISNSSMVGSLYEADKLRPLRDAGFTLYYLSINIGAFFGPLLAGLLQNRMGFHYAFGAAAIGMTFGLSLYAYGRRNLPPRPAPNPLPAASYRKAVLIGASGFALVVGVFLSGLLNVDNFPYVLLVMALGVALTYFARLLRDDRLSAEQKRHICGYIPIFFAMTVFVGLLVWFFSAVAVYFDKALDRQMGGFIIPVSWKDSLQSLWVILFAGVLAALWTKLGERQPKTPMKISISIIILGISYLCFLPFSYIGGQMPILVFALVSLIYTFGEIVNTPVSISIVTKIAPAHFKTQMLSLVFLSASVGLNSGGMFFRHFFVANYPDGLSLPLRLVFAGYAPIETAFRNADFIEHAGDYFLMLGMAGVVVGIVLLGFAPLLNRLLKGID